ncbi:MAG TPA: glycogen/starch synthase [Ilumatobacter sp.]|nr:glycogen/starch synthase [Ilumatobacter sp.]
MKVLFATAELAPLARVGGLAEAAAGLVAQLRADGVELELILPDYERIPLADETTTVLDVPGWASPATARRGVHPMVGPITLVAVPGVQRPHPYVDADGNGWPDNDLRFFSFSAAVAAIADSTAPDVVHLNDWHTAPTLAFMQTRRPSMLTIHTLGYQGICSPWWLGKLSNHAEAYQWYDVCNPLVGGIRLADSIVAVSPTYSREIVTAAEGQGHEQELAARGDALVGILNGIDVAQWNPATDRLIASRYHVGTVARGKKACRSVLLERVALPDVDGEPVIGVVSRLVDQKGIDLLVECLPFVEHLRARVVVLGSGDRWLADALRGAAATWPDRVAFVDGYDGELAHQIFAGADLFVMPSRFEPCGLAQMQAMAYGTLPVVTDVGGLHDTVIDADDHPATGTGIVMTSVSSAALADALHRGVALWRDRSRRVTARTNGMTKDWSWKVPAAQHIDLYRQLAEA